MTQVATLSRAEAKELAEKWGAKNIIPDDIIDAYETGKKSGIIKLAEKIKKRRQENLLAAMSVSIESINYLEEKLKLEVPVAYLQQMIFDDECFHKTLIVIDKDKYLSKTAKKAYEKLMDKSKKLRESKKLMIDFALMPNMKFNNNLLLGDGYYYHYGKENPRRT